VNDAGARSHPLHVARRDESSIALGVLVLDLPVEHICHRLESAMGMIWSPLGLSGGIFDRSHLIEQKERADVVDTCRGEWAVDQEAASFEGGDRVDGADGFALFVQLGHLIG
jgi:hypothetical protein